MIVGESSLLMRLREQSRYELKSGSSRDNLCDRTIMKPQAIQMGNEPEFISRVVDQWTYAHGVAVHFIGLGEPVQNAFIESFNGMFRYECLNQIWFVSPDDARRIIEAWRVDFNTVWPHSSLGIEPRRSSRRKSAGKRAVEMTLRRKVQINFPLQLEISQTRRDSDFPTAMAKEAPSPAPPSRFRTKPRLSAIARQPRSSIYTIGRMATNMASGIKAALAAKRYRT